jgi:FtsP/CotA-like multicopper oxidase with cupredoxin domain
VIVATKNVPVRIKFLNLLPTGAAGKLFVPTDTTLLGAGLGPDADWAAGADPADVQCASTTASGTPPTCFAENRATLHLHGGRSPWISDGTPHQWITPAGENGATEYSKGASVGYVPDMWFDASGDTVGACAGQTTCGVAGATNNPGPGAQTFYYTNQQSARLMFYHDHAWGITRLNVYVGEAAGYVITDTTEQNLIGGLAGAPANKPVLAMIPLVIQDKTFVDSTTIPQTDPTWAWGSNPGKPVATPVDGDLWWPHVYMPAQNPFDVSGMAPYGRWHYGPWFWPPTNVPYPPIANPYYDDTCVPDVGNNFFCQPPEIPSTPHPSWGAEAFLDTPVVNGTAYPWVSVPAGLVRFRVLNAAHDRFFNLQLYVAADKTSGHLPGGIPTFSGAPADRTEVAMVPATFDPLYPDYWPVDHREGGVPNPAYAGPAMIQIATEGGLLPAPVLLVNKPVDWNVDPTTFNAGNVNKGTLLLGPAERGDVLVDFSAFAGQTLILYNDSPAPFPALDPHYDYYTGMPDITDMGGVAGVAAGMGPNTRTVMQIRVQGSGGTGAPDAIDPNVLTYLQGAMPAAFAAGQDPIIVGQGNALPQSSTELNYDLPAVSPYNQAYGRTFPNTYPNWGISRIGDNYLSFQDPTGVTKTMYMQPKAIQDEMGETFDDYGRMSAKLGLEMAFTQAQIQTFVMQNFIDPATEILKPGETQIWKITHNGVDTHPVHFHLFDVQLLNRVGWDGFIRFPDPNELGWKDTVKISPLEDTIVAVRARLPQLPFAIPASVRPLNPAAPLYPAAGSDVGFTNLDPLTGGDVVTTNVMTNFGYEYVWHCHILSHEEMDMMRAIIINPIGVSEILFRNTTTGENALWFLDGVTVTGFGAIDSQPDTGWSIAGRADFDRDGHTDILWSNTVTGLNAVWYMNGTTVTSFAVLDTTPSGWSMVGTGDFNGDGKPDILWTNTTTSDNAVWYMDNVSVTGVGVLDTSPSGWSMVGTGDFNGDGKTDILWTKNATGENAVWYMNGVTVTAVDVLPNTPANMAVVGSGDFNNDIKRDLLLRDTTNGDVLAWYMDGVTALGTAYIGTAPPAYQVTKQ